MAEGERVHDIMDSFRRIVQALRSSHRAASYLNLTGAQLFVLSVLGEADHPLSLGEVAQATRTDQSTVSVVVGRLERAGLVSRVRSSEDNRRVEISLTRKGQTLEKKAPATVAQQRLADSLERMPGRRAALLAGLLQEIVEAMGEADAPAKMLFEGPETASRRGGNGHSRKPVARA